MERTKKEIQSIINVLMYDIDQIQKTANDEIDVIRYNISNLETSLLTETTRLERLGFYEGEGDYYSLDTNNDLCVFNTPKGTIREELIVGNSFKTEEDALLAAKRNEIRADLLRNSKEFIEGHPNWTIEYNTRLNTTSMSQYRMICTIGATYFTQDKAKEMINKWGNDLKLLKL